MIGKFVLYKSIFFLLISNVYAQEICNRTAVINNQEVLVDLNSNARGEGLRSYLKKDKAAERHLNDYQASSQTQLKNAALGTFGVGMIIGGLLYSDDDDSSDGGFDVREGLIIGGLGLMAINYLLYKTIEFNNEEKLEKSIEEYNKRNVPKIYFVPYKDDPRAVRSKNYETKDTLGIFAGVTTDF